MKHRKSDFVVFLLISIYFEFASPNDDDIRKAILSSEKKVDQIEKDLIQEQKDYKSLIKLTLNATEESKKQVKNNNNLKSLIKPLTNLVNFIKSLLKSEDFALSNFQRINGTDCKKLYRMIDKLEDNIKRYLEKRKETDDNVTIAVRQIATLKLEYFANFIFLNKTQSESVLATIAANEKLVEKNKAFEDFLYTTSYAIANILYDLKVYKYKICEPLKDRRLTKQTQTTSRPVRISTQKKTTGSGKT